MKTNRMIWNIGRYMCLALLVAFVACTRDEFAENTTVQYEKGLCFSLYADGDMQLAGTRTAGEDALNENRISTVDIFLFKNDGSLNAGGYAHADVTTSDEVVYLYKGSEWLANFNEQEGPYTVYALANYKGDTQLSNVQSLDDLKAVVAKDVDVVKWEGMGDPAYTGKTFLMDGKQTVTYAELQSAQGSGQPYVANVPVARAAVKIELTLKFSDEWATKFMATGLEAQLSNYASITPVLAEGIPLDGDQRGLSNYPGLSGAAVDNFSSDPVFYRPTGTSGSKIRFYTYVNRWDDFINNETMLLIDLPGRYDENGKPGTDNPNAEVLTHNFYKVPIISNAAPQVFQRNTFYQIIATVDMKGTETVDVPVELTNVLFKTAPWDNDIINVGEGDTPSYLVLNETHVDIRNANGYDGLEFYSSSPITSVTIIEGFKSQAEATAAGVDFTYPGDGEAIPGAFFVDKDNERQTVDLDDPNGDGPKLDDEDDQISVTWDEDVTKGKIYLTSTSPENVTKRYITLAVTNEVGTKYVVVEQYPLEYIQPIQGYYSYRDDFWSGEGKFDFDASGIFTTRVEVKQTRFWGTSTEIINPSIKNSNSYFSSKVFDETNEQIYQYRVEMLTDVNDLGWSWGSWTTGAWGVETRNGIHNNCKLGFSMFSSDDNDNPMMYFITITQTSGSYKIAHPLREEINFGTEQSPNVQSVAVKTEENDNLVSPQFMLASQLGTTSSNAGWTYAREHCANYVETYKIGNQVYHLDDWRLPTSAEIEVIIKYQNNPNTQDVMATVLAGANYYVTKENGSAATGVESGNSVYIRCIRDVLPTDGFMQQINN